MEQFFSYLQLLKEIQKDTMSALDDVFRPYGLTATQAYLLLYLKRNGRKNITELSDAMCTGKSNISPLCKRMEMHGYVKRLHDAQDNRIIYIELTARSEQILNESSASFDETLDRIFGGCDKHLLLQIENALREYHDLLQNETN